MLFAVPMERTAMSIAPVTRAARTEPRRDGPIDVTFAGRFGFGIDRWAYLPFEVPVGVQRIRVATSHEYFALCGVARNVLDLGIFGPAGHCLGNAAGFRGWVGGARGGLVLFPSDGTPGLCAGRHQRG